MYTYMFRASDGSTPVGINEKGFVNSNFGMFLLLDYCIENERGVCRYAVVSGIDQHFVQIFRNCLF